MPVRSIRKQSQQREEAGEKKRTLIDVEHGLRLDRMYEEDRRRGKREAPVQKTFEQHQQKHGVRDMQSDIDEVIKPRPIAGHQMIQVEREESELTQMKRIKEMSPLGRIGDIRIGDDQSIVKMKRMSHGPAVQH